MRINLLSNVYYIFIHIRHFALEVGPKSIFYVNNSAILIFSLKQTADCIRISNFMLFYIYWYQEKNYFRSKNKNLMNLCTGFSGTESHF